MKHVLTADVAIVSFQHLVEHKDKEEKESSTS